MGNCLRSDKAVERNEEQERYGGIDIDEEVKKITRKLTPSNLEEERRVMRIKVVVTREELEQIVKCSSSNEGGDYLEESSLEKLVTAMKLRGRRVFEVGTDEYVGGCSGNWRPALESIPEDH